MASIQEYVDMMFKKSMEKQEANEVQRDMEDMQPQPFRQDILVKFLVDRYNAKYDFSAYTLEEKRKCILEVAQEARRLMGMTMKQIKEFFKAIDEERIESIRAQNDRVIFEFCLIREVSSRKDLVGDARLKFREMRWAAYEAGMFDYSVNDRKSEEILIRMEDIHFPDEAKKLKDTYVSTYEELLNLQREELQVSKGLVK